MVLKPAGQWRPFRYMYILKSDFCSPKTDLCPSIYTFFIMAHHPRGIRSPYAMCKLIFSILYHRVQGAGWTFVNWPVKKISQPKLYTCQSCWLNLLNPSNQAKNLSNNLVNTMSQFRSMQMKDIRSSNNNVILITYPRCLFKHKMEENEKKM